jgi:aspartate racemase
MDRWTGILGLGSRSTLFYIEQLNKGYNKKHGDYSTFPFKMLNVDFQLYNTYLPAQYEILLPQLQKDLSWPGSLAITYSMEIMENHGL